MKNLEVCKGGDRARRRWGKVKGGCKVSRENRGKRRGK